MRPETLIVGGSLSGLTTALALSNQGMRSTVLERSRRRNQRGVAIGVTGHALRQCVELRAFHIIEQSLGKEALNQRTYPVAWWDLYSALREAAEADSRITLADGFEVVEIGQDTETVWAHAADGQVRHAPALLGADGL